MAKPNSSERAYDAGLLMENFAGCSCPTYECSISEYDKSIDEISVFLQYSRDMGDEEEVAYWKRLLQRTKVEKRRLKAKMSEIYKSEVVLT